MLRLIRAFLNSGILVGDLIEEPGEGTPQGGPLSPLLSNNEAKSSVSRPWQVR